MSKTNKFTKVILSLLLLTISIFIIGIFFGSTNISIFNIGDNFNKTIILDLRLPRLIGGFIAGATLAAAGLIIQITLKNSLADSSILGFQSGATLVAYIVILIYPNMYPYLPFFAFLGGMLVYLLISLIYFKNQNALYLILSGLAISAVIRSFTNLLMQLFASNIESTISWSNGSLNAVSKNDMYFLLIYGTVFLIIALVISKKLDIFLLTDKQLTSLGINVALIRFITISIAILLSSISVSFIGTLSFVGLLSPHISRKLVNNKASNLMPTTILVGGLLVMGADTLQRIIFPIYEIPVGSIMSLIGGSYLIYLIYRRNNA